MLSLQQEESRLATHKRTRAVPFGTHLPSVVRPRREEGESAAGRSDVGEMNSATRSVHSSEPSPDGVWLLVARGARFLNQRGQIPHN